MTTVEQLLASKVHCPSQETEEVKTAFERLMSQCRDIPAPRTPILLDIKLLYRRYIEARNTADLLTGKVHYKKYSQELEHYRQTCVICAGYIDVTGSPPWYGGHNADPVVPGGRCCSHCNANVVIPARIKAKELHGVPEEPPRFG
jgi:hypothetical protein